MRTLAVTLLIGLAFRASAEDAILHVPESRECDVRHDGPVLALCGEKLIATEGRVKRVENPNGPNTEECDVSVGCDATFVLVAPPEHLAPGAAPRAKVSGSARKGATITLGARSAGLRVDARRRALVWAPHGSKEQRFPNIDWANIVWAGDLNHDGSIDLVLYTYVEVPPSNVAMYRLFLGDARGQLRSILMGAADSQMPPAMQ